MRRDRKNTTGKTLRRAFRGSRRFVSSCRNGGSCPYCHGSRTHANKRREPIE